MGYRLVHDGGSDVGVYGLHGLSRDLEEVDVVGAESAEILGAEEILGALMAQSGDVKQSNAFQQALARKLARRAPILQKTYPTKKRRWTVGFGPTAIPANSTVTIQAQPQVHFRGEKIIDTSPSGPTNLFIAGLFVGQKSQLPTFQNAIAMSTYAGTVLDNELLMDTCEPALFITFQIQNVSSATLTWACSIVGHVVA